ncbi:unnamed protein product [Closterium sp. NIES-54]
MRTKRQAAGGDAAAGAVGGGTRGGVQRQVDSGMVEERGVTMVVSRSRSVVHGQCSSHPETLSMTAVDAMRSKAA